MASLLKKVKNKVEYLYEVKQGILITSLEIRTSEVEVMSEGMKKFCKEDWNIGEHWSPQSGMQVMFCEVGKFSG